MRLDSFSERSGTKSVRQMQGGCARTKEVLEIRVPFSLVNGTEGTFLVSTSGRCV